MASIQFDAVSGQYRIRFRFRGKGYFRSLKTDCEREAQDRCGAVGETIRAIERGYMTIPPASTRGTSSCPRGV